jgi:EAL domain-containing protein (putative c-di-GMP-specific phosphodiesterase class I)
VLRRACRDVAAWCDISVAVNLSPVQFEDDDLLQTIKSALADAGLPPHRLELEITEGVLLANDERANNCLAAFGRLGVRLAMDDFGTGYSSMSYLTRFRFDKIKIDRAFVSALDRGGEAIIRAIIGMSRNLEIVTCAEGIETEEQLHALKRLGCDEIQGYGYGRPMSLDELKARFAPGRPLRVVSSAA